MRNELLNIRCRDCQKKFICPAIPVPVHYCSFLMGDGNQEDFKLGLKLLQGDVFIINCPLRRTIRMVEAV